MYIVLKVIAETNKELIASDIAKILDVSIARVTVALKTLEERKLIVKEKSKIDKRKTIVFLTDLGYQTLENKYQKLIELVEKSLEKLTIEECEQLLNIYKKLQVE